MTRVERLRSVILLIVLTMGVMASAAGAETRRYAVIVAHTGDADGQLEPLEYADEDGARYYEMFSRIANEVRLYTILDERMQRVYVDAARAARAPRRGDVLAGLTEVFAAASRDVRDGHQVVFYFVLVGHGKIGAGGEGFVSLLDGTFTRTDVFQEVLARSPANVNHLIVDACDAYFLVHRRGGEPDDGGDSRHDAIDAFVAKEELARYPNTGVLLSTSSERETHEWSLYRAGVFSHELRSAMAGAADVNGDGVVEYSEIDAFLAAANQHVKDPDARVEAYVHAPAVDVSRPLVDLRRTTFPHWLHVPAGEPLRLYLEDQRGVRYLDAHLSGERPVVLGLATGSSYYVRTSDDRREVRIALDGAVRVELDRRAMRAPRVAARGAVEESFRIHLYEEPFGVDFYRGFVAARGRDAVALDVRRWRPGPVDAAEVDAELQRLNGVALRDPAMRRGLSSISTQLIHKLEKRDYAAAMTLLGGVETGLR